MSGHRFSALLLSLVLALGLMAPAAMAQTDPAYPSKPIRIVVPFPPGGYADLFARILAANFGKTFGQPGVVENRPGAGGNIGADIVAKSAPDGYTVVMGTIGTHAINPSLYRAIPYDAGQDFEAIAFVADAQSVLVVHPSVSARSVSELIALARSRPTPMTFASAGTGTTGNLAGELFKIATGTPLLHVPYKGNTPALTDLAAGQVDMSFATLQTALPYVQAGRLVALATLDAIRSPALPDVPSIEETGVKGLVVRNWAGLFAPNGTPPGILRKLALEVDRVMRLPDTQAKLHDQGLTYTPMGPPEFTAFALAERRKWGAVVKAADLRAD